MQPASVGPYEIVRELGRGGMGEVYLARDTRLEREVAIKVLPAHLAGDGDRLARFRREAKMLAALNHARIGAIYGLEEVGGHQYLILEYVEGETLAARLGRGAIPIEEAMRIGRQIAEALEVAHEKGIVHRDLKPSNVMITGEGAVKVLDFGLARGPDAGVGVVGSPMVSGNSPTLTTTARTPVQSPTMPGAIMGTAGYMSPEQARGKPVDKRSDIFAFGCVLYEMVTGCGPFNGETVADSLGATLHREPDWALIPEGTPPLVQMLLRRSLAKERTRRLHDMGDARVDLETALDDPTGSKLSFLGGRQAAGVRPARFGVWGGVWGVGVIVVSLLALGIAGWVALRRPAAVVMAGRVVRFDVEPPAGFTLQSLGEGYASMCISPAGDKIVFGARSDGTQRLFVRDLSQLEATPLAGTEGARAPAFSPDGRWVLFFANELMRKVPVAGGPALTICEGSITGPAWMEDGTIAFGNGEGIWRVKSDGGQPVRLTAAGPNERMEDGALVLGFNRVDAVPGANYVLGSAWDGDSLQSYAVLAVSLKDGSKRTVLRNATDARFVAPDRLVFLRESSLMTVPFDPVAGKVTGDATLVVDGVQATRWGDAGFWATSKGTGTLIYVPGGRMGPGRRLIRVDATGKSTPLMDGVDAIVGGLVVSPDGRDAALATLRSQMELWTFNFERRSLTLVNNEGESWSPTWTPDGTALLFARVIPGKVNEVVRKPVLGLGGATTNVGAEGSNFYPTGTIPGGDKILMASRPTTADPRMKIGIFRPGQADKHALEPIIGRSEDEFPVLLSPDGELLACASDVSGRVELYVRPFDKPGQRLQVSPMGIHNFCWSHDGKRLFFLNRQDVMFAADVERTGGLRVSQPVRLFNTVGVATLSLWGAFDAMADGSFLMVEPAPWEIQPAKIRVVMNWSEELRRLTHP